MANKYLREVLIPAAATETTIYTVPDATTAIIRSLRATNANAARTSLQVTQYNAGDATLHYVLKAHTIAPDATMEVFNGVPFVMESGDVLKVRSSQASSHFYLSYLEVDRA